MMYVIFKVKKEDRARIDEKLRIDLISRQSITVRDGDGLGLDDAVYVLIEGSEEAVELAKKEFDFADIPDNSQEIYSKFKAQEEDAASGMGLIFQ